MEEKYKECMNPLYENVNIIEVNVDILITFSLQMNEDKLHRKIIIRRRFITSPLLVLVAHVLLQETGDES